MRTSSPETQLFLRSGQSLRKPDLAAIPLDRSEESIAGWTEKEFQGSLDASHLDRAERRHQASKFRSADKLAAAAVDRVAAAVVAVDKAAVLAVVELYVQEQAQQTPPTACGSRSLRSSHRPQGPKQAYPGTTRTSEGSLQGSTSSLVHGPA